MNTREPIPAPKNPLITPDINAIIKSFRIKFYKYGIDEIV
jgi:hypothetical protein